MATLDTGDKNFAQIVSEIKSGQVKIPQFQRRFVWDVKASAKLLDSIIKGYPIGTFIYWRTDEELRSVRNLGNLVLPQQSKGEFVNYVLDGQQRLTSFYAAVEGLQIEREVGKIENYANIYLHLEATADDDVVITDVSEKLEQTFIRLADLMKGDFTYLASFPKDKQEKLNTFKKILEGYNFRGVNLKHADIEVATEVFTRLNVGGKELTLFEIMVAKTYDATRGFDLAEKYDELKQELQSVNYETISSSTVLQVVSMLMVKNVTRKEILRLPKKDFIDMWGKATDCIKSAIDFLRNFGVPVSRLLPYNALLVPFSYFFYNHKSSPSGDTLKLLQDFFWRCSLGYRYSSGVEGKLAQDVDKIDKILEGETPKYEWSIDITENNLKQTGNFSAGKSFIKGILCLYAMHKPKSFNNNLDVRIDNAWLKISTSKNYHHFFPKAWMRNNFPQMDLSHYNHILNITIVDDELNKNKIRAKAPADYIQTFANQNEHLAESLATHLIGNIDECGISTNDYETFFNKRAEQINMELNKRIIPQKTGSEVQVDFDEELEEETTEVLN
ncbi:MAG: DUF262 domain-containing protein [Saprospiraceae bacterium]